MSAPRRRPQRGPDPGLAIRRRRRQRKRRRPLLILLLIVAALVVGAAVAAGGGVYAFGSSCDLSALHEVRIGQNTFVYAADGSLLGAIPAERNRQVVPLSAVSPWMPKATIAIEDRRFYKHGGVDPEGIVRALVADIRAGHVVQGGSTITQQLVRNLYIGKERTLRRKLTEACLAVKLNRQWSKDRILQAYVNQVYYGNHAYGIEAAAQTYFSRHARGLAQRELARRLGEVGLGRRLDPVGEVPVVHLVEVRGEDALLRPRIVELDRETRLLQLPLHGPLVGDVEVAHELLGDRRTTLDDLTGPDVREHGTRDALRVDAAVGVEPAVLDRDRGLRHPRAHSRERDDLPVALGRDRAEERAVGCVDKGVLADPHLVKGGEVT